MKRFKITFVVGRRQSDINLLEAYLRGTDMNGENYRFDTGKDCIFVDLNWTTSAEGLRKLKEKLNKHCNNIVANVQAS